MRSVQSQVSCCKCYMMYCSIHPQSFHDQLPFYLCWLTLACLAIKKNLFCSSTKDKIIRIMWHHIIIE